MTTLEFAALVEDRRPKRRRCWCGWFIEPEAEKCGRCYRREAWHHIGAEAHPLAALIKPTVGSKAEDGRRMVSQEKREMIAARLRKPVPEGHLWCSGCKCSHPEAAFSRDHNRRRGFYHSCRESMRLQAEQKRLKSRG